MKNDLRKAMKSLRAGLNMEALSEELCEKLVNSDVYYQSKNIMFYYPMKDEVNLLPLLKDKTKNFYLPKVDGNNLLCCPYCEGDELCLSCFKTKEPVNDSICPSILDLIIVPALAVDKNNYRLGYGGGFYDRFLKDKDVTTVVCVPKELIVETVYPENYDVPIDKVIYV